MNAMRLNFNYNSVKQCQNCNRQYNLTEETEISVRIISFQLADRLLHRYSGNWELIGDELQINLKYVNLPLHFDLNKGILSYGNLRTQILAQYTLDKRLDYLIDELIQVLDLPAPKGSNFNDPLFSLMVKLIEIFHARCGLNIIPIRQNEETKGWEISFSEKGPRGWINIDGIAENRFGEKMDIKEWYNLRPEKFAAYVFGFNRFCKHYKSPLEMPEVEVL